MAIVSNTLTSYGTKGTREDLADVIYNISPEETPFVTAVGRGKKPGNTFWEWMTDSLASPDTANAQLEGDDVASYDASGQPTRVGNYQQISRKTLIIADTQEELDKAGRASELSYQASKKGAEMKRDIESICLANQFAVAGNSTTARKTAALLSWIRTNVNKDATGANPSAVTSGAPTDARTDGTTRTFTETILKDVLQKCWTAGANIKFLLVGGAQKQVVSGFSGIATRYKNVPSGQAAIVGAADVYVSDFGEIEIVPDRFGRNRDAIAIDPSMASLRYLRPFRVVKLAKTGDAEKRMLIAEWGLQVNNEAAFGLAADLS